MKKHSIKTRHAVALKKQKFLQAFSECGAEIHAAAQVGVNRKSVWTWKQKDPAFKAAYEDAQEQAVEELEREARRRALHGVDEPVYYKDQKIDTVKKYSDTLLIFLLNAARPEKYRANQKPEGDGVGNVTIILQQFAEPSQQVTIDTKPLRGTHEPIRLPTRQG